MIFSARSDGLRTRSAHRPRQLEALKPPELPCGTLTGDKAMATIAALLPENAIIIDEASISAGRNHFTLRGMPRRTIISS